MVLYDGLHVVLKRAAHREGPVSMADPTLPARAGQLVETLPGVRRNEVEPRRPVNFCRFVETGIDVSSRRSDPD